MRRAAARPGIIPSLASADPLCLSAAMDRLQGVGALHLDIEDGNFVPNITFGLKTVRSVAAYAQGRWELDVHLLVNDPGAWIEDMAACGVQRLAFHPEATRYPLEVLWKARSLGMKTGFGLNFSTPASFVLPFVGMLDYVIVMTAEPDGQGMRFCPAMLRKITQLSGYLGPQKAVWVDGAITPDNIAQVVDAGACVVVAGRAVFGASEPAAAIESLYAACRRP